MTRSVVSSRNFDGDADGAFPANFTNLNGSNAQVVVDNPGGTAGKFHVPYGNIADARDSGTFTNDQYAKVTLSGFNAAANDMIGVGVRYGTGATGGAGVSGYRARVITNATNTVALYKVVTGTETQLGSTQNFNGVDGDTLSLEVTGTSLTVFKNDVAISGLTGVTDATHSTGKPGVMGIEGGNATLRGDTYEAGNITVAAAGICAATLGAGLNALGTGLTRSIMPAGLGNMG